MNEPAAATAEAGLLFAFLSTFVPVAVGLTWIFCAWASATAAESKHRSSWGWALVGLLFGPLALLALAAMGVAGVPCLQCREAVARTASVCPHCGSESPFGG